jgi:hypothetical protein
MSNLLDVQLAGRIMIRRCESPRWRVTPSAPIRPALDIFVPRHFVERPQQTGIIFNNSLKAVLLKVSAAPVGKFI